MATTKNNIKSDLAFFDYFWKATNLPWWAKPLALPLRPLIRLCVGLGVVQVSTIQEHLAAYLRGIDIESVEGHDLKDRTQVTYRTVRTHSGRYHAQRQVGSSTGYIIWTVREKKKNMFYNFCIPYEAYKDLNSIEIPFNIDGTPMRGCAWWEYEYPSFKEACQAEPTVSDWDTTLFTMKP